MRDVGDVVKCRMTFAYACDTTVGGQVHLKGAFGDPVVVTVAVKSPVAARVVYTYGASGSPVVRSRVGDYSLSLKLTAPGRWTFQWTGTGTGGIELVESATLDVEAPPCM